MGAEKETIEKTYEVRFAKNAVQNLDGVIDYIIFLKHQPINAIRVAEAFLEAFNRIGRNPLAFKECEQLATKSKMYRRMVCFSWLIIYRVRGKEITVLGIIHTSSKLFRIKSLRRIR
jgi:plasmid stabilization system protein ParE